LLVAAALICQASAAVGQARLETAAPRAILIDLTNKSTLFEKNADDLTAPASLAKLMTVEVAFDQIRRAQLSLEDEFTVSEQAAGFATGSVLPLRPGAKVKVRDLMLGLLVASANNASLVVAEGIAGSVPEFVALMNERAKAVGLTKSRFTNPHGLPDAGQRVTMREMAILAAHLIREYPEHYALFGETKFMFGGTTWRNRNPVLGPESGGDGLKTGQTREAGYALVASAERSGRRLVLSMNGLKSEAERAQEARKLLEWGFREP
jgi:D-alanyl-D-alanine carboxypeptidase (penicillin-binding protein 5/6)